MSGRGNSRGGGGGGVGRGGGRQGRGGGSDARGGGRGGDGRGRGGREGRGEGRGRGDGRGRGPDLSKLDTVLTNSLYATVSSSFEFYLYAMDAQDKDGNPIESRGRRSDLFNLGFWDGLLKDMPTAQKDDLKRLVYFAGSFFFSARKISGLEKDKLPYDLVTNSGTDRMTCVNVIRYTAPLQLQPSTVIGATQGVNQLAVDSTRCLQCTKTFMTLDAAMQHSREKGHQLSFIGVKNDLESQPAQPEVFLMFVNMALQKAMSERLLKWGNEFYDKNAPMPAKDRNGIDLGVTIFEAISLSFSILKDTAKKPRLALTCDLKAKVIRNKSVLDAIYEDRRNPEAAYTQAEKNQLKHRWIGEIVIYRHDRKCYTIVDLDFDHSAASLPVPDVGISHQEYFAKKGVKLEYPNETPMIVVLGRRNQKIHLPPELVTGNELEPRVREMLPMVASFKPEVRNKAIEKIKTFLTPGSQTSTGGTLLPAVGIILDSNRIQAAAQVLSAPELIAAGIQIPPEKAENWAPMLGKANFRVEPKQSTQLNVVVFHHKDLGNGAEVVYNKIRDLVNSFNTHYRFGTKPIKLVSAGDQADHWGAVEKYFSSKPPDNLFVLDFAKPKGALDQAYPVVKMMLSKSGYLSQFVNFKTYAHHQPRDERKSSMILQGVARQILQKAGVRLWWVSIPKQLPLPAVFVGVDVFHAPMVYDPKTKKRGRKASVAAIIIEVIRTGATGVKLELYSKTHKREGGEEYNLGDELKTTLQEAMKALKVTPGSLIVWRDGMPESAYAHADEEIRGLREGLQPNIVVGTEARSTKQVPMAYVICQKRIATKFLTPDGKLAAPSGTLVTSMQGLDNTTFYINGRAPPYSTPKPVRYVCMMRDKELASVPLAQLTWGQCHAYPNWTGPIKVPSVTMRAHKLAELAGNFADGGDSIAFDRFKNKDFFL